MEGSGVWRFGNSELWGDKAFRVWASDLKHHIMQYTEGVFKDFTHGDSITGLNSAPMTTLLLQGLGVRVRVYKVRLRMLVAGATTEIRALYPLRTDSVAPSTQKTWCHLLFKASVWDP